MATQVVTPSQLAGSWTFEPVLLATVVVAGAAYGRGLGILRRRSARADRGRRAVAFYAGLGVVVLALVSPLDALSSTLFSAHMVQHLLLMLVAPPLLVYARPATALTLGLPAGGRQLVRRGAASGPGREAVRALTHPVVVWVVGTVVLWSWHMPALYDLALSHVAVHAAEHATFIASALLFWAIVLGSGARRGLPRPLAVLVVLATGVASAALGVVLAFASTALYPAHAHGAAAWGLSPLEDQQLAGALMWGPPGLLYVAVMVGLLVRWFAEMDDAPDRLLVASGEHR